MSLSRFCKFSVLVGTTGVAGALLFQQHRQTREWQRAARREFSRASYNSPPPGYRGPLFRPRLDFPPKPPSGDETFPWLDLDFKTEPERYLRTVRDYCLEGNIECDFRVEENGRRDWYHIPWMSFLPTGREPIHGMTMERPAAPGMLADTQRRRLQTWAVAFYNAPGAFVIGNVWKEPSRPKLDGVVFPEGTIGLKLLFTEGSAEDIPYLKESPVWHAAIAREPEAPGDRGPPVEMRLIQMDVAVRDERADIGWVFGTFVYHSSQSSDAPWRRLVPVCLQWGNDPDLTQQRYQEGARPVQTWNNPRLRDLGILAASRPYLGWLGRANGPVDNFKSCCASCHSTASVPDKDNKIPRGVPPNADQALRWFRNLRPGQAFEKGGTSLDYSLQLSSCTTQYNNWKKSYLQNTLLGTLKEWWLEVHPFPTTAPPSGKND
ncbi:Hypp8577 [Branchiostoma lanceolatum]|uniref:Hypp8577 protein n=1 Tax=Branchiostoma lanceolatum TaxID=7740 RepID=A0A8J9Z8I2_BRALA|nr:Hypp8577 [Branchiostoma lanceolatum]